MVKKYGSELENQGWQGIGAYLVVAIFIGVVFSFALAAQVIIYNKPLPGQNLYTYTYTVGTYILIAGACFSIGALFGFLFGIPKMLSSNNGQEDEKKQRRVVIQNDNLVQISDWLTKIIVGVGLTQLYNIPKFLLKIGDHFAKSFNPVDLVAGRNTSLTIIIYFLVLGFICMYLWTRLFFTKKLNELELLLDNQILDEIHSLKNSANQLQQLNTKQFGLKDVASKFFKIVTTEDPAFGLDTQKGLWGGKSESNNRKISAIVTNSSIDDLFEVDILVESINQSFPLSGFVAFHLHETFRNPDPIIGVIDGKAKLKLEAVWGAFTVGAETDNGNTVLELNLAELPNIPDVFKNR